jgi:hypothetical protein
MPSAQAALFDEHYFRLGCGRPYERTPEWLATFDRIAAALVREINPATVLDVGCAMGFLVEGLRARGVEATGIDISEYAISQVAGPIQPYCRVGSIAEPLLGCYDLITCIEVLEHLPADECDLAIRNLCQASDDILFSSTPFDYREATHFNVQPPEFWAERFALQEFIRDTDFDATFIAPWAVRFRRRRDPWHRAIRIYERRFWLLWKENADLRQAAGEARGQAAQLEEAARRAEQQLAEAANQVVAVRELEQRLELRERRTRALEAELAEMQKSRVWRLLGKLRRLRLPPTDNSQSG